MIYNVNFNLSAEYKNLKHCYKLKFLCYIVFGINYHNSNRSKANGKLFSICTVVDTFSNSS